MEERQTGKRRPDGDSVDDLATQFLTAKAAGETPDPTELRKSLGSAREREEFDEILRLTDTAVLHFPVSQTAGQVLAGRYRLLEELGAGGMGKVWSALDLELEREVAVKVLNLVAVDALATEPRMLRESKLLAQMGHPGIVAVHEAGADGDLRFLVMDLVDGASLADVLVRLRAAGPSARTPKALVAAIGRSVPSGSPPLVRAESRVTYDKAVARIMIEALRALAAAHAAGVLHRDLKPANLMLCGGGQPVLLDFGLGGRVHHDGGEATPQLYGTVCYLAPEQIESDRVGNDVRTDIYQVGLVLYEFLTRQRAYQGKDTNRVLADIRIGRFAMPRELEPEIPAELEDIVLKAIETNPVRRYSDAVELRVDLERFVEGRVMPEAARGRSGRSWRRRVRYFGRRFRLPLLLLVAVLILVLGARLFAAPTPRDRVELQVVAVGLETRLSTERERHVYAYLLEPGDGGTPVVRLVSPRSGGMPSVPGTWSIVLEPGEHVLTFDVPAGGATAVSRLCLFTCSEERNRARLAAGWLELAAAMARSGRDVLPLTHAESVLRGLDLAARAEGGAAAGGEPLSLEQPLDADGDLQRLEVEFSRGD